MANRMDSVMSTLPAAARDGTSQASCDDDADPSGGFPSAGTVAVWALVATAVALAVVAVALALWKLKLVVALLFLAFTIAAAMRPGVEVLARRGVPRGVSVILHYLVIVGAVAALLAFVVPPLVTQVRGATGQPAASAASGDGIEARALAAIDRRLSNLPSGKQVLDPAISVGKQALHVVLGLFFTLAGAAYWIYERDRTVDLVTRLLPATAPEESEGHLGPDRREARRVHSRSADPDRVRRQRWSPLRSGRSGCRTGCCSGSPPACSRSFPL